MVSPSHGTGRTPRPETDAPASGNPGDTSASPHAPAGQLLTDARGRLLDRLDGVRNGQVAVIAAPPGFGKNDLVESWIARSAGLHEVQLTAPMDADELRQRLAEAEAAIESPRDLVVLTVTSHRLATDAAAMGVVIENLTPRTRLVVAARVRPDIPLGALAARGRLVDIDGPEMAYTRSEAAAVLAANDYEHDDEMLDRILELSDGWPVVVNMIARMGLSPDQPQRLQRLMDSYIADAIIRYLSDEDIDLLVHLSMMDTLDPQTASMLSGRPDAAAQLSRLQSIGVPIAWDSRNTIRLNPMLTSYLRRDMQLRQPELYETLLLQATSWLRTHNRRADAVQLAVDARRFDLAWMIIGDYLVGHLHEASLPAEVERLSELVPEDWPGELMHAVTHNLGSPQSLLSHLHSIDNRNMVDLSYWGAANYTVFFLGLMRRAGYPRHPQFDAIIELAAGIGEDDVIDVQRTSHAALQVEYGLWLLHANRLDEARQRLFDGVGLGRLVGAPWVVVLSLGGLAVLNALQGNRDIALRMIEEADKAFAATAFDGTALDEYALLARAILGLDTTAGPQRDLRLERLASDPQRLVELDGVRAAVLSLALTNAGDPRGAVRLVNGWRDELRDPLLPGAQLLLTIAVVLAETQAGELDAARAEVRAIEGLDLPGCPEWVQVLQAHIALMAGDAQEAHDLLAPLVGDTSPLSARSTLSVLGTYGVAAAQLGDFAAAADATERARVLAQRLGMEHVGARFVAFTRAGSHEIDLTDAERNVLVHLNPTATLGQIAEEMFISTNTLKTHLRRIYRKLGVNGRDEAIERGRALGIIRVN